MRNESLRRMLSKLEQPPLARCARHLAELPFRSSSSRLQYACLGCISFVVQVPAASVGKPQRQQNASQAKQVFDVEKS